MSKRKIANTISSAVAESTAANASKARKVALGASDLAALYSDVKFLLKSEPEEFSIDTLRACPDETSIWDGIRNPQARNNLRLMKENDLAYFYYSSNKKETGIHGLVRIVKESFPDPSAIDPKHKYYDPKCEDPNKWSSVNIKFVHALERPVLLTEMKADPALSDMALFKQSRLSVQIIKKNEAEHIFKTYMKNEAS